MVSRLPLVVSRSQSMCLRPVDHGIMTHGIGFSSLARFILTYTQIRLCCVRLRGSWWSGVSSSILLASDQGCQEEDNHLRGFQHRRSDVAANVETASKSPAPGRR